MPSAHAPVRSRRYDMEQVPDVSFPPLPSTVTKVGDLITAGTFDLAPLLEIVKRDPSISVNVLRRANSAYYGVRRNVDSVDQAVRLLGFREVSTLVLIEGMQQMQGRFTGRSQRVFRDVLRSAVFTGRFAQTMTKTANFPWWTRPAFASGLLFVAGRLVLVREAPARYADLAHQVDAPLPSADDEQRVFGLSHESLAPRLCVQWALPDRIGAVLGAAATPGDASEGPQQMLAWSVWAGSRLSRQDLAGETPALPERLRGVWNEDLADRAYRAAEDASAYAVEMGSL